MTGPGQGQPGPVGRAPVADDPSPLRLAALRDRSRVNGPDLRAVVWVQGCRQRCPGCFNPQFQPFEGGLPTPVPELAARLLADPETEGVTFSGGEPFAQAAPLARLARALRSAGKGVLVFTGHERRRLEASRRADWRALLEAADLLVAGPYRQDRPLRHPLLASANQELVFLTERYRAADLGPPHRRAEYRLDPDGTLTVTGFIATERRS